MFISKKKVREKYEELEQLKAELADQRGYAAQVKILSDFRGRRIEELREQVKTLSCSLEAAVGQAERARAALQESDTLRKKVVEDRDWHKNRAELMIALLYEIRQREGECREEYLCKVFEEMSWDVTPEELANIVL